MVHLITGYAGYEHIQSEDDGAFNAAFFGNGQYVMETGNQFEGSIINNNTVRILDGDGLMYGRHFRIKPNTYEDLNITTGTAGTRRVDMICMTYEKNAGDGTEQAYLQVVKGAETSGTPAAPSYTDGNILDGATFNQMPLYKVEIEGVVLSSITALFDTIPTYKALAETYEAKFKAACQSHLDSLGVLDTMEEITANTQSNQLAGALGVKQIYNQLNTDLTGKVIIENITVTIGANTDYSYVPYKTGYVLVAVHGTTFAGIYVTGFADTGSNYSVFYNVPSSQTASITLSLMWVKI